MSLSDILKNDVLDYNSTINPLFSISECRFCLGGGDLISICNCIGTIKFIHKKCLLKWVNRFPIDHYNHTTCQLCKAKYPFWIINNNKFIHKKCCICM